MSQVDDEPAMMEGVQVIELHMVDTRKYYPYIFISSMGIRTFLYPLNLVKTRLQIQKEKELYKGTFDAIRSIGKTEGLRGFYKGLLVSSCQIFPGILYITMYERTRSYVKDNVNWGQNWFPSFAGGALASLISQTIVVPVDIVTQHLMLIGGVRKHSGQGTPGHILSSKLASMQKVHLTHEQAQKRFGAVKAVMSHVYEQNGGLRGFYKGYWISLGLYVPNSALWWTFYSRYSDMLTQVLPDCVPRLPILWMSAPLAGITAASITNPLDVIRARMQVKNERFYVTVRTLWQEERQRFWIKGLMPRLMHSSCTSFLYMFGYETVKKLSLKDEYKHKIKL